MANWAFHPSVSAPPSRCEEGSGVESTVFLHFLFKLSTCPLRFIFNHGTQGLNLADVEGGVRRSDEEPLPDA
jgi:hypothetical protein